MDDNMLSWLNAVEDALSETINDFEAGESFFTWRFHDSEEDVSELCVMGVSAIHQVMEGTSEISLLYALKAMVRVCVLVQETHATGEKYDLEQLLHRKPLSTIIELYAQTQSQVIFAQFDDDDIMTPRCSTLYLPMPESKLVQNLLAVGKHLEASPLCVSKQYKHEVQMSVSASNVCMCAAEKIWLQKVSPSVKMYAWALDDNVTSGSAATLNMALEARNPEELLDNWSWDSLVEKRIISLEI